MNALVGYTGFVGSHLISPGMEFYNRANLKEIEGKHFHRLYISALPAEKWKANKYPDEDRDNMNTLMRSLERVTSDCVIVISTIDVYESSLPQDEFPDLCPNIYASHAYGKHRKEFEDWCTHVFKNVFVFRLPALFGYGLKKNALYDLINNNQTEKLRGDWMFQWYDLKWLSSDIDKHIVKDHHLVNLVTPSVRLSTLQMIFFPNTQIQTVSETTIRYNFTSLYGYSHSLEDVIRNMALFLRSQESRLLVSELAWNREQDSVVECFLRSRGITRYEIVPSKRNWDMKDYTNVYSAQSLLYGVDIQIFQEQDRFLDLLKTRLGDLSSVGTQVVVFGSPKQRLYKGEYAVTLFRKVGDIAASFGIMVCIENNARVYGGNWLTTAKDTAEFVKQVDHSNIWMNLDIGSLLLEGETETPDLSVVKHVQVSFPNLGEWQENPKIVALLSEWKGPISLEMVRPSRLFESIDRFVQVFSPSQISQ